MNKEFRERVALPVAIPVGALMLTAFVVLLFSQVLLAVPKEVAVAVALMVAINVLGGAAVLAMRPRLRRFDLAFLGGVAGLPVLLGAAVAFGVVGEQEHGEERPVIQEVQITAANSAFDKASVSATSGSAMVIEFTNNDAVSHNISIFKSAEEAGAGGQALFTGELFAGKASRQYKVGSLDAGTYFFRCDAHPTMTGTLAVSEAPIPETQAKGAELRVVAKGVAFDHSELLLPPDVESTIELRNEDAFDHNLAIYENAQAAKDAQGVLAKTSLFTGPASEKLKFTPPAPGTYYFQCDVHPTMSGTVKVG